MTLLREWLIFLAAGIVAVPVVGVLGILILAHGENIAARAPIF